MTPFEAHGAEKLLPLALAVLGGAKRLQVEDFLLPKDGSARTETDNSRVTGPNAKASGYTLFYDIFRRNEVERAQQIAPG